MQCMNDILESAVLELLYRQKDEIIKNITLNISYNDVKELAEKKEFLLLNKITEILLENTSDTEKVKKITWLFKENHIVF